MHLSLAAGSGIAIKLDSKFAFAIFFDIEVKNSNISNIPMLNFQCAFAIFFYIEIRDGKKHNF